MAVSTSSLKRLFASCNCHTSAFMTEVIPPVLTWLVRIELLAKPRHLSPLVLPLAARKEHRRLAEEFAIRIDIQLTNPMASASDETEKFLERAQAAFRDLFDRAKAAHELHF